MGGKEEGAGTPVEFVWAGAVTSNSVRVKARTRQDSLLVRLLVSEQPDISDPVASDFEVANGVANDRIVSFEVGGLAPDQDYYYAVEVDGEVDQTKQGHFRTFAEGAFSFTFAVASCAQTGSTHDVFYTIRDEQPLFFLHMGDLHYENIAQNEIDLYRNAYRRVLTAGPQAALYRSAPIVYMWDDHDYGINNSDATAPGREAARLTYQEYVPHYPLAAGSGDVPIYQSFDVGRVHFIVTDLRSERTPDSAPDDENKTMLGQPQKAWLREELLRANEQSPLIVWVGSVPWIAAEEAGEDHWGGFATERAEMASFIEANDIGGMLMLSGDAHMLAIDNGANNYFAPGGGPGFPVLQAAALDRVASIKGGPYSHGVAPGRGQFGLVTVEDRGGDVITVTLSGRNTADEIVMSHRFAVAPETLVLNTSDVLASSPALLPRWYLLGALLLLFLAGSALVVYRQRSG